MAECTFCKSETKLYDSGMPVCIKCSDARGGERKLAIPETEVLKILRYNLEVATERAKAATGAFDAVTSEIPSWIPHSDGTQRIHNASREMSQARVALMIAHKRLNDYVARGIVPYDLKRDRSDS